MQDLTLATNHMKSLLEGRDISDLAARLRPRLPSEDPLPRRIPFGNDSSSDGLQKRRTFLCDQGVVCGPNSNGQVPAPESLKGNIENLIGYATLPVGIIGPLRINGINAHGDFFVPLATTEGALVASYHRGAHVISQAGGAAVACLSESVSRAPCFVFDCLSQAAQFLNWVTHQMDNFQAIVDTTTRHGSLIDVDISLNGRTVCLIFHYDTGDAAGQNMVTVATEAICNELVEQSPIKPITWYLEGNLSGDKKATMLSFLRNRGKKVVAEVSIAKALVRRFLNTTPGAMADYCRLSTQSGVQSGSVGVQGHYANALAGLFIACGQDAACVAEASTGITDMAETRDGDLYVSVSLPNLIVGTVGGGTHLPSAKEYLEMMRCYGTGKASAFAEICAATVLAGEISIIAALAAGDFGRAHATFRHKPS